MKSASYKKIKSQEARSRMAALRQARQRPQSVSTLQKRASLVGNGAKWHITNFAQVAQTMAKWA